MPQPVPRHLIELLQRLGLSAAEVQAHRGRVERLLGDLPLLESAWVDALCQARLITPFQADQINAGRGESLRLGPYVLLHTAGPVDYAVTYRARHVETGQTVRLSVATLAETEAESKRRLLERMATAAREIASPHLAPLVDCGREGPMVWVAHDWVNGRTADECLVHQGRFPPEAVWELGRSLAVALAALESAGLCHGDISTRTVALTARGEVVLLRAGLRGVLRPEEGFAHADLQPAAYDTLAPERIVAGSPPTVASDIYACGCVLWQLLCGRSPLSGGDSLSKLQAAQAGATVPPRRWAHDVPDELEAAILACLAIDPAGRPRSAAELAARLGSSSHAGRRALARCARRTDPPAAAWARPKDLSSRTRVPHMMVTVAAGLMLIAAVAWPLWRAWTQGGLRAGEVNVATRTEPTVPAPRETADRPRHDPAVKLATFDRSTFDRPESSTDVVLPPDRDVPAESIRLAPGQCVRSRPGRRARIVVPSDGMTVEADRVRFENIDFAQAAVSEAVPSHAEPPALVTVTASQAEFRGCSFRSTAGSAVVPEAIAWSHLGDPQAGGVLPSGRLRLKDCLLVRVGAGVRVTPCGAARLDIANALHLGSGPLVRVSRCPTRDETVQLVLTNTTLRAAGAALQCRWARAESPAGEISILATDCVFAPESGAGLLEFVTPQSPEPLLESIKWTGQGSLVLSEAGIAVWRGDDGRRTVLDDSRLSIGGLVRSGIEFAGSADSPQGCRLIGWQAPLQSTSAPGADVERVGM